MKCAAVAAALVAAVAATSVQPTMTTTIMTTQYSTYVYTVYDTTVAPTSTPSANSTVPAPTAGNYTVSMPSKPTTLQGSSPSVSPSIAPVPKSGAAGLAANWVAGAAAAGFAVAALL